MKLFPFHIILFVLIVLLYVLFPTRLHFTDGVYFAYNLEHFPISYGFHINHLFWLPLMHILYKFFIFFFPHLKAMTFLQLISSLFGGFCFLLFFKIIFRFTNSYFTGIISALFLSLSWGFIHYSTDSNVYIALLFIMLFILYLIMDINVINSKIAFGITSLLIFLCSLHKIGFFFSLAVLLWVAIQSKKADKIRIFYSCLAFYSLSLVCMYYLVFLFNYPRLASEGYSNFVQLITVSPTREYWTIISNGFFESQETFIRAQFNLFFHIKENIKAYYEQAYYESYSVLIIYLLLHVIILFSALIELKRTIFNKSRYTRIHPLKIFLFLWFFSYFIFNQLYSPFEVHYKLFYLPPIMAIWAFQILESSRREKTIWTIIVSALVCVMGIWNISTGLIPNSNPDNNPYLKNILQLDPYIERGDLIIYTKQERNFASLARYYTKANAAFFRPYSKKDQYISDNYNMVHEKTISYLKSNFHRIFISDESLKSGYPAWVFLSHQFPLPCPSFLVLEKNDFEIKNIIKINDRSIYHEISLK